MSPLDAASIVERVERERREESRDVQPDRPGLTEAERDCHRKDADRHDAELTVEGEDRFGAAAVEQPFVLVHHQQHIEDAERPAQRELKARDRIPQRREGDQLIIELGGQGGFSFHLFGNYSADLEANVQLPPELPVTVRVGSGDASVDGVQQLHSSVGSGDLHVSNIAGAFSTSVGSGDVDASDVGSLHAGSVGSGDLKANGIRGDAKLGSIGSGDVTLRNVGGSVHADTLGSGDLGVHDVGGDLSLGAKGSGDVNQSGVKGKVSVPRDDD